MNNNKLTITILHPSMKTLGGAENVILWSVEELLNRGHQVTVISAGFSKENKKIIKSFGATLKSIKLPFIPHDDTLKRNLWIMGRYVTPYLKNTDIICVHNFPATLWLGYACGFNKKRIPPVVWCCHEPPRWLYAHLLEEAFHRYRFNPKKEDPIEEKEREKPVSSKRLEWLRAVDQKTVNQVVSDTMTNSQFTADNVAKIYNTNPIPSYFGIKMRERSYIEESWLKEKKEASVMTIVAVSRIELAKNIHILIKAIHQLKKECPELNEQVHVHIIGKGSLRQDLITYTETLHVNDVISFEGFLEEEEIENFYKKAHVMVYTPVSEPLGLVPIEAGVRGVPTIGSNQGGPAETIIDKKTGLLVDPSSIQDMINALTYAMANRESCIQMGIEAEKHCRKTFNITKTVTTLEDICHRLVKKNKENNHKKTS